MTDLNTALAKLDRIRRECDHDDHDGEGVVAVPFAAIAAASQILFRLRECGLPIPDVDQGTNGGIDLHWNAVGYEKYAYIIISADSSRVGCVVSFPAGLFQSNMRDWSVMESLAVRQIKMMLEEA